MIEYKKENVALAIAAMAHMPHMEVLEKYLPELLVPEVDNSLADRKVTDFKAAIYNMETGNRLDLLLAYLQNHPRLKDADIILANEVDQGMARSANVDVTRALAQQLGMNYAFGVEFLTADAWTKGNKQGLGGNAILSRYKLNHATVIHLPIEYDWFLRQGDCRLGVRMAVAATIEAGGRTVCVCSAHLDNRISPAGRANQMRYLLEQLDREYGRSTPVLLGGDMNTNTVDGDAIDGYRFIKDRAEQLRRLGEVARWEPMLAMPAMFGYRYDTCNIINKVTRRKPDPTGDILLNLDWFFVRDVECRDPGVVTSIFDHSQLEDGCRFADLDGRLLSDHDCVYVTGRFKTV